MQIQVIAGHYDDIYSGGEWFEYFAVKFSEYFSDLDSATIRAKELDSNDYNNPMQSFIVIDGKTFRLTDFPNLEPTKHPCECQDIPF